MKVKELIEKLQQFEPEMEVIIDTPGFDSYDALVADTKLQGEYHTLVSNGVTGSFETIRTPVVRLVAAL